MAQIPVMLPPVADQFGAISRMQVSVIIPCYNAEKTLAHQLKALSRQEFAEPWEIIVADNGSTDRSIAVTESFQKCLPRLRIVRAPEIRGAAYARNQGARAARAESLLFCDADDEAAPGYVRAMFEALSLHPFVACRFDFDKLNVKWITRCHYPPQVSDVDRGLLGPYTYAGGGSLGVKKQAHEAVGGFDENIRILEDVDYCIRLQRAGFPLTFAPEPLVYVRSRTTIPACFAQAYRWGRSFIAIRDRHCPTSHSPATLKKLLLHLLRIRRVRAPDHLAKWIWATGWQLGSIQGWRERRRNFKF